MDDPDLTQAAAADVPAIVALMNRAYRGRGADAVTCYLTILFIGSAGPF